MFTTWKRGWGGGIVDLPLRRRLPICQTKAFEPILAVLGEMKMQGLPPLLKDEDYPTILDVAKEFNSAAAIVKIPLGWGVFRTAEEYDRWKDQL